MKSLLRSALLALIPALALMALGSAASASTLNQNVSWTIDRAGTTTKYRVVAYGDSIYAGYNGSTTNAAKYLGADGGCRVPVGAVERGH
jgi:hypothetical protein